MTNEPIEAMETVLEHYGLDPVRLDGRWRAVLCPFHGDTRPSARATSSGFACMACGIKGDVISLIMEVDKCEASRAFEIIEELTGEKHSRVSEPVTRKSWGVPPFEERDKPRKHRTLPSGIRQFPDLGG